MTSPLLKLFLLITSIISSNNAYYISLHALKWPNASIWCQSYCSSHLASIHSTDDHLTMLDLIDRNPYIYTRVWIGLNDIQTSDIWQWSDGTLFDFGNVKDPITGFLARGTYPWRSDEPDYNDSDECVAYEVGSNYPPNYNSRQWVDRKKTDNYHFACNSCSGRLHKYAAVDEPYNYSYAQDQCQYFFGTSLASIHSDNDMMEARIACKQLTSSLGCWIGLKKVGNVYQWVDGTEWDYGQTLQQWPWYVSEPGAASDQLCIFLDPDNGNDPGDYLWDDFWCNDRGPKALCNAPSEICDAGQWFIAKGKETDYIFTESPCELTKTVMDKQSVAILWDKQYFNSLGTLSVEMMYSITDIIHDGNVGVVFYFDETNCDNYYYIGIWPGYHILFIGKKVNDEWTLLRHKDIEFVYNMGTFYALKIDLTARTMWTISLNTIPLITNYIDDSFNNSNNKLSGYIGIRNVNASFIVKSLFISGEVQYFDNSWYFGCTEPQTTNANDPTSYPTMYPTIYPTLYPTIYPTNDPSIQPTSYPTIYPTMYPTIHPTLYPTIYPTLYPTLYPTSYATTNRLTTDPGVYSTNNPSKTNELTTTPTSKYNHLIFVCYYNDKNGEHYKTFIKLTTKYVEIMINAILETFELMMEYSVNRITDFEMCSIFTDEKLTDINICFSFIQNEDINADYTAMGSFGIVVVNSLNEHKKYIMEQMESKQFREEFTNKMNNNLQNIDNSTRRRNLLQNNFEAVAIQIIDTLNTTTSQTPIMNAANNDTSDKITIIVIIIVVILLLIVAIFSVCFYFKRVKSKEIRNMEGEITNQREMYKNQENDEGINNVFTGSNTYDEDIEIINVINQTDIGNDNEKDADNDIVQTINEMTMGYNDDDITMRE